VATPQPVGLAVAPLATAVLEADPTWPCSGCSEQVSLEAMACPRCTTAFMGGVNPNVSLKVPVVGELVGMSGAAKFGVMAGGATLFTTLLLLVLVVLGHLF
jgi:predicted lipid-binding transport protein (Tim44 family)